MKDENKTNETNRTVDLIKVINQVIREYIDRIREDFGLFWSLLKGCFGVSALPCGAQRGGAEERGVLRKGASRQGRSSTALRVRVCFKPRSSSPARLRASALKTTIPRQIASISCVIRYKSRIRFQQTPEEPDFETAENELSESEDMGKEGTPGFDALESIKEDFSRVCEMYNAITQYAIQNVK